MQTAEIERMINTCSRYYVVERNAYCC